MIRILSFDERVIGVRFDFMYSTLMIRKFHVIYQFNARSCVLFNSLDDQSFSFSPENTFVQIAYGHVNARHQQDGPGYQKPKLDGMKLSHCERGRSKITNNQATITKRQTTQVNIRSYGVCYLMLGN